MPIYTKAFKDNAAQTPSYGPVGSDVGIKVGDKVPAPFTDQDIRNGVILLEAVKGSRGYAKERGGVSSGNQAAG